MPANKAISHQIVDSLAIPVAQVLVKCYFGEPAATIVGGVSKIVASFIDDLFLRKKTERAFTALADEMIRRVLPLFEEAQLSNPGVVSVATQLGLTLKKTCVVKVFMAANLDSQKACREILKNAPLPTGHFSSSEQALYKKALQEAVTYLLQVCDRLPQFGAEHAAESLNRLSLIIDRIDAVLDSVRQLESLVRSPDRSMQYEACYRLATIRTFNYLELFGATFAQESKHHILTIGFVNLTLYDGKRSSTLDMDTVLRRMGGGGGLTIVRGPAGSGKSTLLRWIAINAAANARINTHYQDEIKETLERISEAAKEDRPECERAMAESTLRELMNSPAGKSITTLSVGTNGNSGQVLIGSNRLKLHDRNMVDIPSVDATDINNTGVPWSNRIPFLLLLRHHRDGRLPSIENLGDEACREVGRPPKGWIEKLLKDGRAILLIDGVDEVPPKARNSVARSIITLLKAYPNCQALITTRAEAIGESWLAILRPHLADINPMSAPQREVFIRRWHEAVAFELELQSRAIDGIDRVADELHRRLVALPRLASLATNPLLCAMICAINRDRNQTLPETQADLCEVLCSSLLQRDTFSGLEHASIASEPDELYWAVSHRQRLAIVQEIAHYMVKNDLPALDHGEALDVVKNLVRAFRLDGTGDRCSALLQGIVERSGVLRAKDLDALDFIHNSLKEFLAGKQFADNNDYGLLAHRALDATWQNVLMFAVAVGPPGFAVKLVNKLIVERAKTTDPDARRRLALLIARARSEALHFDDAHLESECTSVLNDIMPPRSVTEASQLAELGEQVVPFLRFDAAADHRSQAACVRTLRLIGGSTATEALHAYEQSNNPVVESELAQAMHPLEVAIYRSTLLKGDALPAEVAGQITDLRLLEKYATPEIKRLNLDAMNIKDLSPLKHCRRLRWLFLSGLNITDLSPLASLRHLEFLYLADTRVENLEPLVHLKKLRWLDLESTPVSDITPISELHNLEWLDLRYTRVASVRSLSNLKCLRHLNIASLPVAKSALTSLKRSIPFLEIKL